MKRTEVILGAGLLLLAAGWMVHRLCSPALLAPPLSRSPGSDGAPVEAVRLPRDAGPESPAGHREDAATELEPGTVDGTPAQGVAEEELPPFRVFGRVVDGNEVPVSGVDIRIDSGSDSWWRAHETEEGVSSWWHEGWSQESDFSWIATASDGTFELRGVLPGDYFMDLVFLGPPYLSRVERGFNDDEDFYRPLFEGDNDLGTIELLAAGAITGVVMGPAGEPLPKVGVQVDEDLWNASVPEVRTDEAGRFTVVRLLPASYEVSIEAEGFQDARRDGVDVVPGVTTGDVDFTLERAPTLSGRVVDSGGRPVVRARVLGHPSVGNRSAVDCFSDASGAFLLELERRVDHFLQVERVNYDDLVPGEISIDSFEPDTSGIEVVIPALQELLFEVRDARTGDPVEEFGLRAEVCRRLPDGRLDGQSKDTWNVMQEIYVSHHEAGRAKKLVEPGEYAYAIQAPGYAPQREPLRNPPGPGMRQLIQLEPESRIRGRALLDGEPVAGAAIRLYRQSFEREPGRVARDVHPGDERRVYDLDPFLGRPRDTRSAEDGSFAFTELAAGSYGMELKAESSSQLLLDDLRIESGEVLDLGSVLLGRGSAVRGTVRVAPGLSPEGLFIQILSTYDENDRELDSERHEVTVRSDGSFEFPGLTPRTYTLVVYGFEDIICDMEPIELEVLADQDVELEIDLRPWQSCRLRCRATRNGQPVAGAQVMLVRSPGFSPSRLGITDRHGRLDAFCTPERGVTFELLTSIDTPLGLCPEPTDLPPGGEVEVEIEVVTGSLVLRFPPDFEVPDGVGLRPALTIVGGHLAGRRFGPEPDSTDPLGVRPARDLGAIAIGNYAIRIVGDSWLVNDGQIVGREERDLLEGDCEVRAGERAVCVLRSTTR